ncbi:MAG: hypothetical protein NDJ94_20810 [Vicinamibacteria bacterium]|nr:hypothetical protein [Vicinamibacteria bacterium]
MPSRRLRPSVALALVLAATAVQAADAPTPLASYSFDEEVDTGPDTFRIFQGGRGHVAPSEAFRLSGHRSIELRDVAGDGDFPELVGFFPERRSGRLQFHFAFLVTDPAQEWNAALAGPRGFSLDPDGIAFWLQAREGRLVHVSDSIPKRLFAPEPFVWYRVDVSYRLAEGRYDLTIAREGQAEAVVALRDQPNGGAHPGSAVDKFSFVGAPFSDSSDVVYYVDDVAVWAEGAPPPGAFVAPGRRRLFVELFDLYQRRLAGKPRCLPVSAAEQIGLEGDDLRELYRRVPADALDTLLRGDAGPRPAHAALQASGRAPFEALANWAEGCAALERGAVDLALRRFEQAAQGARAGDHYALHVAVALAALDRFDEADLALAAQRDPGGDDARHAVVSAFVGLARGDLDAALAAVRDPASRVASGEATALTFAAVQYYHVLLWRREYAAARDYARQAATRPGAAAAALWHERGGDASLFLRDLGAAEEDYLAARVEPARRPWVDLKLADVAFLRGDLETERLLRERHYGGLR